MSYNIYLSGIFCCMYAFVFYTDSKVFIMIVLFDFGYFLMCLCVGYWFGF